MLGEERLNSRFLFGRNVGNDDMLVGSQAEDSLVHLGNLAQSSLKVLPRLVLHSSILDKGGEVTTTVVSRLPTKVVDIVGEGVLLGGGQLVTETLLHLGDKASQGHAIDGVLHSSILPVGAVTVVALGSHDGNGHFESLLGGDESDHVGETRVGGTNRAVVMIRSVQYS